MGNRTVVLKRKTKETDIKLTLDMDAKGVEIDTPVAFFNHMLTAMAFHGGFALKVKADGDVDVDPHHLVEDIGLVLGERTARGTIPVVTWTTAPANLGSLTFRRVDAGQERNAAKESSGIYFRTGLIITFY